MKSKFLLALSVLCLSISSCAPQTYMDKVSVENALSAREFTFMAKHANPTNYDVINVMNSLPNSTSSRMLDLDYGYGFTLKNNEIEVTLPYFGRTYTPTMDPQKAGYRFTSKDFEISEMAGKKNSKILVITPHDVQNIRRIVTEIFPNGSAYVAIDSNDRQPISYDGYITKNEAKK